MYHYDGRHFSNLSVKDDLATEVVKSMFEDKYHNVWVSSAEHGTSYITPQGKMVTVEKTNNATPVNYAYLNPISQEVQGNDDFRNLPYMAYTVYDYEKNIFVKKEKKVLYNENLYQAISLNLGYWGNHNRVICILLDKAQNYWVSTGTGVLKIFPSVFTFSQEDKNMLSGLYQIYEDKYGKIWFGSNRNGAVVYDGKSLEQEPDFLKKLNLNYFAGYLKDEKGNMLLMSDNNGLLYFDGKKTYKQYGQRDNTSNGKFIGYCVHKTKKGHYIYGSEGRGLAFFKHLDSLKSFGTNGVRFVGEDKGVRTGNILTITEDNYGHFWFGRPTKGIGVYDENLDRGVTFQRKDVNLDYGTMSSLTDAYGNIWFGTDKGLCHFTPPAAMPDSTFAFRKNMKRIASEFLGTSLINYLAIWKNKYLVIGNAKGMSLLDLEVFYRSKGEQVICHVLKNYGYPYTGSVQNAVWIDSKDQIWAVADQGVVRFDPNLFVADTVKPSFKIDSIHFYNQLKISDLHFIKFGETPVQIHLKTDINPLLYDNVLFRYRIKGDSAWTVLNESQDVFDLKNPTGGFYDIEIQATKDGILSDIQTLKLKVIPWSLVISSLLMFFFSVGAWFYFRRKKEIAKSKQIESRLQVQAIVNQLNPHFINNTLQWVQNRLRDDREGISIIGKLAQNIKIVFKNSRDKKAYHSLQSEMALVENYLHIQRVRFEDSLEYVLPAERLLDKLGTYDVPLMSLQIHIENAIEHGIRNTIEGKGKVIISLEDINQDYFWVTIADNGIGRAQAKLVESSGTQQGTKMLMELETIFNKSNPLPIFTQLYEDEYLIAEDGTKYGTHVTLKIPKQYKYEN